MNLIRKLARALGLHRSASLRRGRGYLNARVESLRYAALRAVSRSSWASSLYYGALSGAFRREHQAVLAGRVRYYQEEQSDLSSVYLLRRNIHRIEKGLIMRPRRSVFAADYVGTTVDSFSRLAEASDGNGRGSCELEWAEDVLGTYFEIAGSDPSIDSARSKYRRTIASAGTPARVPFHRDLSKSPPVEYKDLLALAARRRSVRWFEQKQVPRELIDQALQVAVQAPSACNRQPYHFRIFDTPELVRRIAAIPMGTQGFSDNFPAISVVVGEQKAYFNERDRHVIYIDAALASMSFILALESVGLGSCCINWPDMEPHESRMKAELNLSADERVIMLIAIGYPDPDGMVPYSQKRSIESVRSYE
jgi:nitroreductase